MMASFQRLAGSDDPEIGGAEILQRAAKLAERSARGRNITIRSFNSGIFCPLGSIFWPKLRKANGCWSRFLLSTNAYGKVAAVSMEDVFQ
jgi:hypothetical protein